MISALGLIVDFGGLNRTWIRQFNQRWIGRRVVALRLGDQGLGRKPEVTARGEKVAEQGTGTGLKVTGRSHKAR